MIEVRIRDIDDASAVHLCHWPVTELDRLIPTLVGWGVADAEGDTFSDFSGGFRVDSAGAFFEVIGSTGESG